MVICHNMIKTRKSLMVLFCFLVACGQRTSESEITLPANFTQTIDPNPVTPQISIVPYPLATNFERLMPTSVTTTTLLPSQTVSPYTILGSQPFILGMEDGDFIFKVVNVPETAKKRYPDLVAFYVDIQKDKGNTPIPRYSPIGVSLLRNAGGIYQEMWTISTEIENPENSICLNFSSSMCSWIHPTTDVADITGDGKSEIIMSGCSGFGNRCYYKFIVLALDGNIEFQFTGYRFAGASYIATEQTIVTLTGQNIDGYLSLAEQKPENWQLDIYKWNGQEFENMETRTEPNNGIEWPSVQY
jgi:hypothetical protein